MMFPHVNNVFNFNVNSVSSNGALDFGNTIERAHSVNYQGVGGQNFIGPGINSPRTDFDLNAVFDPDVVDQPQRGLF